MTEIRISSKQMLKKMLEKIDSQKIVVISISQDGDFIDLGDDDRIICHLKLQFDDIDNPEHGKIISEENVNQIYKTLMLIKENNIPTLVCQCDAGISRSSAVAAAAEVIINGPREDSWIFESKRYLPNMIVYNKILRKFMEEEQ